MLKQCLNIKAIRLWRGLLHTAISIKVVPKTREKVEYERERLIGKVVLFPNTLPFTGFPLSIKLNLAFL